MCGIVGYVGGRPCRDLLIAGLEKLEYRGYDSAGLSLLDNGRIDSVRAVGNLSNLRAAVAAEQERGGAVAVAEAEATIGLAHTRWATHGRVTEENAHPHSDEQGDVHIVLNGIVENHSELRRELRSEGHEFSSETDAEVLAHLIAREYHGDLHADNIIVTRRGLGFDLKLIDLFHRETSHRSNVEDDIVDLAHILYHMVGGRRHYAGQPPEIKEICKGLRRDLIVARWRSAEQLRRHLETMEWVSR